MKLLTENENNYIVIGIFNKPEKVFSNISDSHGNTWAGQHCFIQTVFVAAAFLRQGPLCGPDWS
jgi:hypothetical protein